MKRKTEVRKMLTDADLGKDIEKILKEYRMKGLVHNDAEEAALKRFFSSLRVVAGLNRRQIEQCMWLSWFVHSPIHLRMDPDPVYILFKRKRVTLRLFAEMLTALIRRVQTPPAYYNHVNWVRVIVQHLCPGDVWANIDPNYPKLQGTRDYNLVVKPINHKLFGSIPAKAKMRNGAGYWRPQSMQPHPWIMPES